jgi:hypothetical protein
MIDNGYTVEEKEIAIKAIREAFPKHAEDIIQNHLRYDYLNGNFFFTMWGMYIGIEKDGYIHS